MEALHGNISVESQGETLVRRFTDTLDGNNTLEEATTAAQSQHDIATQNKEQLRMKKLYENTEGNPSLDPLNIFVGSDVDFDVAELAREALRQACDKFARNTKPSSLSRIGIQRKSARSKANGILQGSLIGSITELESAISTLETGWVKDHGRVYKNFQRLCKSLDAHKKVFEIFPSQNTYVAVLSGSLSVLLHAAVNHELIGETIAKTVADILIKASQCTQLLEVLRTQALREQLSEMYSCLFTFYRNVIEWYMKHQVSRFFGSFNEHTKENFSKAAAEIENCIRKMYRQAQIANLAMNSVALKDTSEIKTEVSRYRQELDEAKMNAGMNMREYFMATHRHFSAEQVAQSQKRPQIQEMPDKEIDAGSETINRTIARTYIPALEHFIVGDEGQALFHGGTIWAPGSDVSSRVEDWMSEKTESQVLWIFSPETSRGVTSARAAALASLLSGWQTETPIISHFCARPRQNIEDASLTIEQAGMIGLVYSLITQLLQFHVDDDGFQVSKDKIKALDGTQESWNFSLELLEQLLDHTQLLSCCIVDGLNDLEWSTGSTWCSSFLDILFRDKRNKARDFKVLLTTSGQSRILPGRVSSKDRFDALGSATRVLVADWDEPTVRDRMAPLARPVASE
ncbi:MAG: hypothetical protein Q9165_005544 [Trypethelium subeluteriae]